MELLKELLAQLAAVQAVWLPFVLALAILAFFIWKAVEYAYATRLTNADSTRGLLERQVQDYRDKLSGASPDEAKARMDAMEARFDAMLPRRITAEEREKAAKTLDPFRGSLVEIASDMASPDAGRMARSVTAAFHSAGWQVNTPMVMGIGNPPPSGIRLEVESRVSLTPQELAVSNALNTIGLEHDVAEAPNRGPVGMRPAPSARLLFTTPFQD